MFLETAEDITALLCFALEGGRSYFAFFVKKPPEGNPIVLEW